MPWKWIVIIGLAIGLFITCCALHCLDTADRYEDKMTAYEYILKNPTAAGKR